MVSCASADVKKVINEENNLEDADTLVVVLRISESSRITPEEYADSINTWLAGYESEKRVKVVHDVKSLSQYKNNNARFYQISAGNEYLKYKSLGVIRTFIADNRAEIQNIMRMNGSEYLVFFEIGGAYSPSLKAMKYNSVLTVVDEEEKIVYLDHQETYVGDGNFDRDEMKKEFIDSLTRRLYITMKDIKFITE